MVTESRQLSGDMAGTSGRATGSMGTRQSVAPSSMVRPRKLFSPQTSTIYIIIRECSWSDEIGPLERRPVLSPRACADPVLEPLEILYDVSWESIAPCMQLSPDRLLRMCVKAFEEFNPAAFSLDAHADDFLKRENIQVCFAILLV